MPKPAQHPMASLPTRTAWQAPRSCPAKQPGVIVGVQGTLRGVERTPTAQVPRLSTAFLQPSPKFPQRKERHLLTLRVPRIPGNHSCGFFPLHQPLFYQSATIASKINKPKSGTRFQDKVTLPAGHTPSIFNNDIPPGMLPPT